MAGLKYMSTNASLKEVKCLMGIMPPNGIQINTVKDMKTELTIISDDLNHGIIDEKKARTLLLDLLGVSGSCSCGVQYVKTKKSDIPYNTDDNVYHTDIIIYHCPKCGNIDRIEEY